MVDFNHRDINGARTDDFKNLKKKKKNDITHSLVRVIFFITIEFNPYQMFEIINVLSHSKFPNSR